MDKRQTLNIQLINLRLVAKQPYTFDRDKKWAPYLKKNRELPQKIKPIKYMWLLGH